MALSSSFTHSLTAKCNASAVSSQKTRLVGARCQANQSHGSHEQARVNLKAFLAVSAASASALVVEGARAAESVSSLALDDGGSSVGFAVAAGGAVSALAAALAFTDPEKRRQKQAEEVGGDEKDVVRNYFNTSGFERWRKIYGETDDVNNVQKDIREGHAQTVEKVLSWLKEEGGLQDISVCDAGCGTGSLTIPLAVEGAKVSASDISKAMVEEASERAELAISAAGKGTQPNFLTSDLESLAGKYHTVACIDVMIHYPQEKADAMISHLASLAEQRLILSFAPYTPYYAFLKRVGELFPGPSKATRAYLHDEKDVEAALEKAGWKVVKKEMTATKFYFSRLFEAVPSA